MSLNGRTILFLVILLVKTRDGQRSRSLILIFKITTGDLDLLVEKITSGDLFKLILIFDL